MVQVFYTLIREGIMKLNIDFLNKIILFLMLQ